MVSRLHTPKERQTLFPWYDPAAYNDAIKLNALSWWNVLSYRRIALEATGEDLDQWFLALKQDPLALRLTPGLARLPVQDTTFIEWHRTSQIHSVSAIAKRVDRWLGKYGHIPESAYGIHLYFNGAPRLDSLHNLGIRFLSKPRSGWEEEDVADMKSMIERATVTVDLTAPDAALKVAFEHWLKEKRASMRQAGCSLAPKLAREKNGLKQFNQTAFNRWCRRRVLDYLDIKIACRAGGRKLPSGVELSRLLPMGKQGEDHYDAFKETKTLADALVRPNLLKALYSAGLVDWLQQKKAPAPRS